MQQPRTQSEWYEFRFRCAGLTLLRCHCLNQFTALSNIHPHCAEAAIVGCDSQLALKYSGYNKHASFCHPRSFSVARSRDPFTQSDRNGRQIDEVRPTTFAQYQEILLISTPELLLSIATRLASCLKFQIRTIVDLSIFCPAVQAKGENNDHAV